MVQSGADRIIDIQLNYDNNTSSDRILRAVVNDNIVYEFKAAVGGRLALNTGDVTELTLSVTNNIIYNNYSVTCDNIHYTRIGDTAFLFTEAGEYNMTLSYKTISVNITVVVTDATLTLTTK